MFLIINIAGNFLYIALVDLIPELHRVVHASHSDGSAEEVCDRSGKRRCGGKLAFNWNTCLVHFGMLCGVGCMVLIKLYGESDGGE